MKTNVTPQNRKIDKNETNCATIKSDLMGNKCQDIEKYF